MRRWSNKCAMTADQKELGGIFIGAMILGVTFVVWNVVLF